MPTLTTLQLLGLAGVLSYAAARFAAKAGVLGYNRYLLVSVPVAGMPAMPRGFRVTEMTAAELATHAIDVSTEVQQARFAQGLTCLGAFNAKEQLVGVNWVGKGPFVEDEVHVRFAVPSNAGWDTGLWVRPEYRLGRGFAALWAGTADWLQRHGRDCTMSRIADYNLASILSHKRMGAETVGRMLTIRFFNWQFSSDSSPRLIRLGRGNPADVDLARFA